MRSDCDFHFLKSNQINTNFDKASPQGKWKFFNSTRILSVTVPRVNQSYNFKGTCNLSRNLCNYVNFVFYCHNLQFRRVRVRVNPSCESSPSPSSYVRVQFTDWNCQNDVHCQTCNTHCKFTARRARRNQLRGHRQDCRTPWTDKVIRSWFLIPLKPINDCGWAINSGLLSNCVSEDTRNWDK